MESEHDLLLLFEHDPGANAFALIAGEKRFPLCANAALRVRIVR